MIVFTSDTEYFFDEKTKTIRYRPRVWRSLSPNTGLAAIYFAKKLPSKKFIMDLISALKESHERGADEVITSMRDVKVSRR